LAESHKAFGRLKWLASGGGSLFLIGLVPSFFYQVPGAILAALGIIIMLLRDRHSIPSLLERMPRNTANPRIRMEVI
jgi:hypothetical protein